MTSLFTVPSTEAVTKEMVDTFCQLKIAETSRVEYKGDFPNNLGKTVAAFANTFGGIILIGVEADSDNRPILPVGGVEFKRGLEERVYQICNSAIYPPLWPDVWVVRFEESSGSPPDRCVVVIRVTESQEAPHAVEGREDIYLRTLNTSQPFRRATVDEIQELLTKRKASAERRAAITSRFRARVKFFRDNSENIRPKVRPSFPIHPDTIRYFVDGMPAIEIMCVPAFPRGPLVDLRDLQNIMSRFNLMRVRQSGGDLLLLSGNWRSAQESLLQIPANTIFRFAEANQYGLFGYYEHDNEDSKIMAAWRDQPSPVIESQFDVNLTILRQAALSVLVFLPVFYKALGFWGLLDLSVRATNMRGRTPVFRPLDGSVSVCPDPEINCEVRVTVDHLRVSLENIASEIMQKIHSAFGDSQNMDSQISDDARRTRAVFEEFNRGAI